MKVNSLLSLVLLAAFASSARAAQSQPLAEPVVLPTYVVDAPRLQLAEQRVNASLDVLRAKASTPAVTLLDLPALKTHVTRLSMRVVAGRQARS